MKNSFLSNEVCKIMNVEERLERFHQFLLDKTKNSIVLFKNKNLDGKKIWGNVFTKFVFDGVIVVYKKDIELSNGEFLEGFLNNYSVAEYVGIFVEKLGKFYTYSLYDITSNYNMNVDWAVGNLHELKEEFKLKCENKIREELLETYPSLESIDDSLFFDNPIIEQEIDNMDWKKAYFEGKDFQFKFEIYNYEDSKISITDAINYVIDPVKAVEDFTNQYDKTKELRRLKKFYLAKKALDEFIPSKEDIIKKEILESLIKLTNVKTVKLYIKGRDEVKVFRMENSIEGKIITCSYEIDKIINFIKAKNINLNSDYATNWSIKTSQRSSNYPLESIYFEDIEKITSREKTVYEKK